MATTTGGTTYVTSTDLVADYPTASLALANRVDVVASGGPNSIKTSGYTITLADILGGNKFLYNSASPGTFTLPTSGLVDGMVVNVAQIGAGALTVSGGTIVGTTVTTAQYQCLQFVYASTGTTWYSVAPPATAPGLAIVTPTSIANSGGSATASGGEVTYSGVSSVSLNGVFTSTYSNYRILLKMTSSLASGIGVSYRLRAAGTDNSSGIYTRQVLYATSTTVGANSSLAGTSNEFAASHNTNNANVTSLEIFGPQLAENKGFLSQNYRADTVLNVYAGHVASNTAFDGITIIPSSGTLTGTIRVYGYKNS